MKAKLEEQPYLVKGIELISENYTEKLMLESLCVHQPALAEFSRNDDGSVFLVIVPKQIAESEVR